MIFSDDLKRLGQRNLLGARKLIYLLAQFVQELLYRLRVPERAIDYRKTMFDLNLNYRQQRTINEPWSSWA